MGVVGVATCQFPVSAEIGANLRWIRRQIRIARQQGAHVAHFPEAALSGYAGTDFDTFAGFDWDALRSAMSEVLDCARRTGLWVILGSAHRLTGGHKPHNSLYIINDSGNSSIATTRCSAPASRTGSRAIWRATAPAAISPCGPSTASAAGH